MKLQNLQPGPVLRAGREANEAEDSSTSFRLPLHEVVEKEFEERNSIFLYLFALQA